MIELNAKYLFLVVVCSQTAVLQFLKVMLFCFVFLVLFTFTFLLVCEVYEVCYYVEFSLFLFHRDPISLCCALKRKHIFGPVVCNLGSTSDISRYLPKRN